MRFLIAFFLLLLGGFGGTGLFIWCFGWAIFLCLTKISDQIDDIAKKNKLVQTKGIENECK
jgi:hypothetical protein